MLTRRSEYTFRIGWYLSVAVAENIFPKLVVCVCVQGNKLLAPFKKEIN